MEQRFKFWINQHHLRLIKGIYKITIGGKFYIGSAEKLHMRIYSHETSLNAALRMYPETRPSCLMHLHWAQYIYENPKITYATVDVIQRCVTDSHLYYAEQFYMNEYCWHPEYLNKSKTIRRPSCFRGGENKKWDVEIDDTGTPMYFNPDEPYERISGYADLTRRGSIRKIRKPLTPEEKLVKEKESEQFACELLKIAFG